MAKRTKSILKDCLPVSNAFLAVRLKQLVRCRWIVVPVYVAGLRCWCWSSLARNWARNCSRRSIPANSCCGSAPAGFEFRNHSPNRRQGAANHRRRSRRPGSIDISMGFAGQQAPTYSMNNLILFMRGPDDGQLRIALNERFGMQLDAIARKAPQRTAGKNQAVAGRLAGAKRPYAANRPKAEPILVTFGFEPGDIVSEVMSFGSPTPIEVAVASPNMADSKMFAMPIKSKRVGKDPLSARCRLPPIARLSHRAGRYRSRACRSQRPDGTRRCRCHSGQHFVQPVRRSQLLARSENRHRLPSGSARADSANELVAASRNHSRPAREGRPKRSGARCRHRQQRLDARPI